MKTLEILSKLETKKQIASVFGYRELMGNEVLMIKVTNRTGFRDSIITETEFTLTSNPSKFISQKHVECLCNEDLFSLINKGETSNDGMIESQIVLDGMIGKILQ